MEQYWATQAPPAGIFLSKILLKCNIHTENHTNHKYIAQWIFAKWVILYNHNTDKKLKHYQYLRNNAGPHLALVTRE